MDHSSNQPGRCYTRSQSILSGIRHRYKAQDKKVRGKMLNLKKKIPPHLRKIWHLKKSAETHWLCCHVRYLYASSSSWSVLTIQCFPKASDYDLETDHHWLKCSVSYSSSVISLSDNLVRLRRSGCQPHKAIQMGQRNQM